MSFTKEELSNRKTSVFMSIDRRTMIERQSGMSERFCYHIIRLISYPDNQSAIHWMDDELKIWLYDTYSGVKLKKPVKNKSYIDLIGEIILPSGDYDDDRIKDILNSLRGKYGKPKYSVRNVIAKIEDLFSKFEQDEVYYKEVSSAIFYNWFEEL